MSLDICLVSLEARLVSPGISLVSLETGRVSLEMRLVPLETLLIDRCLRWPRVFFRRKISRPKEA